MTPITDNSGQTPTHAEVLWTTPVGRAFSWLLLFSVFATVSLIKYGGVRDLSYANGPAWLAAIWGWLPSYLAALALPYMWPARRRRYLGRVGPVDFLPEVAAGSGTILVLEILGVPGWIGSIRVVRSHCGGCGRSDGLPSLPRPGAPILHDEWTRVTGHFRAQRPRPGPSSLTTHTTSSRLT